MGSKVASPSPYLERKVGTSLHKNSHGDIVANTLQFYRERTKSVDNKIPKPYQDIQRRLQKTIDEGKRVLIDIKDSYSVQTVVVRFEYVGARWAGGKAICYAENEEIEIPYTIHYSDIFCKRLKIKIVVEGDNPFE